MKFDKLKRTGSIPFKSFREKNRLINQLKQEIGGSVRFWIDESFDGLLFYEYVEFQF
jgi:hypothetical protein